MPCNCPGGTLVATGPAFCSSCDLRGKTEAFSSSPWQAISGALCNEIQRVAPNWGTRLTASASKYGFPEPLIRTIPFVLRIEYLLFSRQGHRVAKGNTPESSRSERGGAEQTGDVGAVRGHRQERITMSVLSSVGTKVITIMTPRQPMFARIRDSASM